MPAQRRITREAIVRAAFDILRKSGVEAVNARSIAKKLDCSTQPIYHAFTGMGELKAELLVAAERRHDEAVRTYMDKSGYTPYMAYGMGFVSLAKREKELFRYLLLGENVTGDKLYRAANLPDIIDLLCGEYGYSPETARALHGDMTVYALGLALGMNAGVLTLTESEIAERFKTEFKALTAVYGEPKRKNGER